MAAKSTSMPQVDPGAKDPIDAPALLAAWGERIASGTVVPCVSWLALCLPLRPHNVSHHASHYDAHYYTLRRNDGRTRKEIR
ncbi:MAG: hypothetical protein AAEJ52_08265 [Myxococcota bacterium]